MHDVCIYGMETEEEEIIYYYYYYYQIHFKIEAPIFIDLANENLNFK